jgi:CheY-like chemotaxis protein
MAEYAGGVIRVLLVDDEPNLARTAADYMEEEHDAVSVVTAENARAGIRKLDESIDCIVSDYEMPGRDGLQLLRAIRDDYPDVPFVLLTGQGSEQIAAEAISAGVTDYVRKRDGTDQFEVLANRIVTLVEKRRAELAAAQTDARLRNLFDRITDAVVGLDDDWRVTHCNGAAEELFDRSASQLEEEVFWVAFPDAIGTRFQERLEAAADRERSTTFEEFYPPLFTWLEVRVYPAEDGVSLYIRELDDVLSTEGDPRALDRKFRAVFDAASDPMVVVDESGVCVDANEAVSDLLGQSVDDVVEEPVAAFVRDEAGFGVAWTGVAAADRREGSVTLLSADGKTTDVDFEVAATFPGRFLVVLSLTAE